MPTDALFEKLRLAERRLTAAEERVSFCRAAATKASAVLGGEFVSRSRDVTVHENAVIRLMEAEQEYVEAERQYSDLRNQVCFHPYRLVLSRPYSPRVWNLLFCYFKAKRLKMQEEIRFPAKNKAEVSLPPENQWNIRERRGCRM